MQIVDSNDFNLRVGVYLLEKGKLQFIIIPVFHAGSKSFYQEVDEELNKCDIILYEGLNLKSLKHLWKGYKRFAKRLNLAYQAEALNMEKYKSKMIHADYSAERAKSEWKKAPLISRILFNIAYPLGFVFLSLFETKRSFVRSFRTGKEIDDQFWFMKYGKSQSLDDFIKNKREEIIFNEIDSQVKNNGNAKKRIGIIYGAGHMKKVLNYLITQHKFKIADAWFLTVLWLSERKFMFRKSESIK